MVCYLQVIFRDGEGALQVLPQLVGVIPEARLNLVVYHLRQGGCCDWGWGWVCPAAGGGCISAASGTFGVCLSVCADKLFSFAPDDFAAAYRLIKDVEPSTPQEYILKAVANAAVGQDSGSVSP